jgi:hypothetical protein
MYIHKTAKTVQYCLYPHFCSLFGHVICLQVAISSFRVEVGYNKEKKMNWVCAYEDQFPNWAMLVWRFQALASCIIHHFPLLIRRIINLEERYKIIQLKNTLCFMSSTRKLGTKLI